MVDKPVCSIRTLLDHLERHLWTLSNRMMLMRCDDDADGHLTLDEVQAWLSDFASTLGGKPLSLHLLAVVLAVCDCRRIIIESDELKCADQNR